MFGWMWFFSMENQYASLRRPAVKKNQRIELWEVSAIRDKRGSVRNIADVESIEILMYWQEITAFQKNHFRVILNISQQNSNLRSLTVS